MARSKNSILPAQISKSGLRKQSTYPNQDHMRYAFDVANFAPYADPRALAQLAHEAEDSGWDGFFI